MTRSTQTKSRPGRRSPFLIYLVDDQPLLLDLAELALKSDRVKLRKFQDPETALRSFVKARTKPCVLVTDYVMGRMSGLDLIVQCKKVHPALKTVLISGSVGAEIILRAPVHVDQFLSKPYQPEKLADVVRTLLAS